MMLARSAGRRHDHRRTSQILAASFAQLNLPWLAPAQLRWTASQSSTANTPQRPLRRRSSRSTRATAQIRRLATAADHYSIRHSAPPPPSPHTTAFRSLGDEHVPFDFTKPQSSSFPGLRPFGDPIVLDLAARAPEQLIKVSPSLSGTAQQLLAHLHTSLGVGRRDRAQAIIQRLTEQCGTGAPETLYAHTAYLEDLLKSLVAHGRDSLQSQEVLKEMQRWFEVEVCDKSVQMNDRILVVMIRAAIRSLEGSRQERSIRRYVDMASKLGDDALDEVLASEDYDDNEYVVLQRATSEYYEDDAEIQPAESSLSEDVPVAAEPATEQVRRRETIDLNTIPQVLETEQKGSGLAGVKKAMRAIAELPALPADASAEAHLERAHERQRMLEETSVDVAIERWRSADEDLKKLGIHTAMQSKPLAALMWQWHQTLLPALEQELEEVQKALSTPERKANDRVAYGPYLELLPLRKVAANTILHFMQKMVQGKDIKTDSYDSEIRLNALTIGLANAIEAEYTVEESAKKQFGKARMSANAKRSKRPRQSRTDTAPETTASSSKRKTESQKKAMLANLAWDMDSKVKLGAMLVSKFIESAHLPVTREHPRTKRAITQMQPAFLHRMKYKSGKKLGMVVPNPALVSKLQSEPVGSLIAKRMPMVVEPRPWSGWNTGGYIHYPNDILRLPAGDKSNKDYFMAADQQGELDTLYKGLTALGKVPWKVNHDVFKVQLEAWNSGDAIANFAPIDPVIDMPPEPEAGADALERRKWLNATQEALNRKSGLHSKRCFQNFQLEIARTVLNETLYFPHNLDFRGRAYPIPPYLNHMGADNVRGLLTFAEGKPLGENGLRWLKIHLATVAGHDKASMSERVEFTMSHLDDIYDSVRNPLDGRRWWLEAEDAWQTLAACFELTKALDSPDPTQFVSYLPVQQDGTCNGLQHYAALGGDKIGAAQVNLEPSDRPADVYTAVAEAVKQEVERDAELGNPIAQKLNGRLTRKCVKQPVMTNVYGVTFFGARLQVAKQLETLFPEVHREDPVNHANMSHYVATKIFKSLGSMFAGAQSIQTWLGQCADRISTCLTPEQIEKLKNQKKAVKASTKSTKPKATKKKLTKKQQAEAEAAAVAAAAEAREANAESEVVPDENSAPPEPGKTNRDASMIASSKPLFRSTVVWTTPLRLPVVQPYRSAKSRIVYTTMQNISLLEPQVWDPVSKRKQLQAFPPNFIHSLDATHMLLSALESTERGMTFASIHDSFWTHACDVNELSEVLRDAFVAMHSEDIIGRLRDEFQARYKGCMYLASVYAQSPLGKKVSECRTNIRKDKSVKLSELALEAERMRLCNSEDPEERAKGEAMVTPGSIVASEADESAFSIPSEMAGQKLGELPNVLPGVDNPESLADTAVDPEAENEYEQQNDETETAPVTDAADETAVAAKTAKKAKALKKISLERKIYVWMPLTFPKVPEKGDFDVKRLRESRYFFH